MAGFNKVKVHRPNAVSYEGGAVYEKSPVNEWLNMLFSSFMEDKFYESALDQQQRFVELTSKMADAYGYEFVAKAAVFARNELGMRSISQLVAAWLNNKTFDNKRQFYRAFMHRPDDVAEIFAATDFLWGKKSRSHALVRGAADYLSALKPQTLAKYKLNSRDYNMYDLINITHAHSKAIDLYKAGELAAADTWEVNISAKSDKSERDQEWKRMVEEHKLGYMALIRNLNNILDNPEINQDWIRHTLVPQITNEKAIHKSLMFPYRFYTAYKNLNIHNPFVDMALGEAFAIAAVKNAPQLDGGSAIILDVSGSMEDRISYNSNITIKEVGACFAIALWLAHPQSPVIKFGTTAKFVTNLNLLENPFTLISRLCRNDGCGYGTDILPAFELLDREINSNTYKRIFIISDMQVMDNRSWGWFNNTSAQAYHKYFGNKICYSFDLGNYHTQILSPHDHIRYVTSLNDQVFKFIGLLESGINLVDYINQFNYC
jgi:hypothetical protein